VTDDSTTFLALLLARFECAEEPQQGSERERQQAQAPLAAAGAHASLRRRGETSVTSSFSSVLRRPLSSRSPVSTPRKQTEMPPVSSDTTDRDGVGLFGDAERRAVAGAELLRHFGVGRQGQEAGRGGDAFVLHDDRAVVERRVGREDVDQQVVGELGVEQDAVLDVFAQALETL
jgi:hypothetical protein